MSVLLSGKPGAVQTVRGWRVSAPSIEEVAELLGRDPALLEYYSPALRDDLERRGAMKLQASLRTLSPFLIRTPRNPQVEHFLLSNVEAEKHPLFAPVQNPKQACENKLRSMNRGDAGVWHPWRIRSGGVTLEIAIPTIAAVISELKSRGDREVEETKVTAKLRAKGYALRR